MVVRLAFGGAFVEPAPAVGPKKRRGRSKQPHAAQDKRKLLRKIEDFPAALDRPAASDHAGGSGADDEALTTLPKDSRSPCVGATPGRFVGGGCVVVVDSWCRFLSMPSCNAANFAPPATCHAANHAGRKCPFRC